MSRNLSAAYQAEYAKNKFAFAHLLDIQLDSSTTEYITDSFHDLVHNSNTYDAFGGLMNMGAVNESAIMQVGRLDITVSGLETQFLTAMLGETFINNEVTIHRAIINPETGAYVDTPRQLFNGNITNYSISEGEDSSELSIQVASNWANFMQINGRVTNSTSQSATKRYKSSDLFNSDYGFQYASAAIADIKWGQA